MRLERHSTLLTLVLVLGACDSDSDSSPVKTNEQQLCRKHAMPLAPEAKSPLGFSTTELLATAVRSWPVEPTLDGRPVRLDVAVTETGASGTYTPRVEVGGDPSTDRAVFCPEVVEVPVSLQLRSSDGTIDVKQEATLVAGSLADATIRQRLVVFRKGTTAVIEDAQPLTGRFDVPARLVDDSDAAVVETTIRLPAGSGKLTLQTFRSKDDTRTAAAAVLLGEW